MQSIGPQIQFNEEGLRNISAIAGKYSKPPRRQLSVRGDLAFVVRSPKLANRQSDARVNNW